MRFANLFRQYAFWWIGLAFLVLAKGQHVLRGYRTPRPFAPDDVERTVAYVRREVDEWVSALARYGAGEAPFAGRQVLELGPGPDLGVGVTLLAQGARAYAAMDVHELAFDTHAAYYDRLLAVVAPDPALSSALRETLAAAQRREPTDRLRYVVRNDFDLRGEFGNRRFDLFVSQAAFEHFDDIERTIADVTALAADDAMLVFGIDFKTHSRWIGNDDVDPLSIYRFGEGLYRLLSFRGIPNRRPLSAYCRALEANGWTDLRTFDENAVDPVVFEDVRPHLDPTMRADERRYLWVMLCARRRGAATVT